MARRRSGRRERRFSRPVGCLFWIIGLVVLLLLLSVLFGGFQNGAKTGGLGQGNATPGLITATAAS